MYIKTIYNSLEAKIRYQTATYTRQLPRQLPVTDSYLYKTDNQTVTYSDNYTVIYLYMTTTYKTAYQYKSDTYTRELPEQ